MTHCWVSHFIALEPTFPPLDGCSFPLISSVNLENQASPTSLVGGEVHVLDGLFQLELVGVETRISPHPRKGEGQMVQVCSLRGEMVVRRWWTSPKSTMVTVSRLTVSRLQVSRARARARVVVERW